MVIHRGVARYFTSKNGVYFGNKKLTLEAGHFGRV